VLNRRLRVLIVLGVIVLLFVGIKVWSWAVTDTNPDQLVVIHRKYIAQKSNTLIVLVHGGDGAGSLDQLHEHLSNIQADWSRLEIQGIDTNDPQDHPPASELLNQTVPEEKPTGAHVLSLRYGWHFWMTASNSDPKDIALGVSRCIQKTCDDFQAKQAPIKRIILVGHSQGALIARKAFVLARATPDLVKDEVPGLAAEAEPHDWALKAYRLVLLAGMNRGWDITGKKPADMTTSTYLLMWTGTWLGDLTGTGKTVRGMQSGAPFVAGLRVQWMLLSRILDRRGGYRGRGRAQKDYRRDLDLEMPATVQLLGDIDDIVSDEDNKDLLATGSPHFTWVKVRGTGHGDIRTFDTPPAPGNPPDSLGAYRRAKVHRAVTEPFYALQLENEEQSVRVDRRVKRIVFVLHGIRDLGRWSADFEQALLARWRQLHPEDGAKETDKLAIVSPRYGYFGMGPFLVRPDRQRFVRWLMDEYTEARARYPEATEVDFVCHSNGTYLLASALEQYPDLLVNRVVFGGSVVRCDYKWNEVVARGQVKEVRNQVANNDMVVGLFPTLFEQYPMRWFGNDLGGAGFRGFQQAGNNAHTDNQPPCREVENVGPFDGGHDTLLAADRIRDVVMFLLPDPGPLPRSQWNEAERVWYCDWASWGCILVWVFLATVLVLLGCWLTRGAGNFAPFMAILYLVGLWWLLCTL
jgi:pimeloyl-ACP methyl ester carboxylesterase